MEILTPPSEAVAVRASNTLSPPDAAAARQFSSLMQGAGNVVQPSPVLPAATAPASTSTGTPLATSLTGLLRERAAALSSRWKSTMANVAKVDEGSSYSTLIKTQFEVGKINLEHAVMTQGISRSTQNVDSLVKMQ